MRGHPAVLYFASDITERKTLEQQLAQAQKMEGSPTISTTSSM
jgi:hypothetical protein